MTREVLGDRDGAGPRRAPQERRAELADLRRGRSRSARSPTIERSGRSERSSTGARFIDDADRREVLRHEVGRGLDVGGVAGRRRRTTRAGNWTNVGNDRNRLTRPPSWSTATRRPMPVGEPRANAWRPAVYAASWSGSTMFCCVTMKPPRPPSTTSRRAASPATVPGTAVMMRWPSFCSRVSEASSAGTGSRPRAGGRAGGEQAERKRTAARRQDCHGKWRMGDSNPRPIDCEPIALPTELIPQSRLDTTETASFRQDGRCRSALPRCASARGPSTAAGADGRRRCGTRRGR